MIQKPIDVSICIVSFNTKNILKDCIKHLLKDKSNLNKEILIADNCSTDGTIEMLTKHFPSIKLIKNNKNLHFHKANNQMLRRVKGKYFLIINSDIFIKANTIKKLVDFMDNNNYALISCRHIDKFGKTDTTCSRFPTPIDEILQPYNYRYGSWRRNTVKEVEVLPGSFLLGKRSLINKIGLFDENLLLFYGDVDYCKRVIQSRYKICHNGKVAVTHLRAKSVDQLSSLDRFEISKKDMLYFYEKYYGKFWKWILWLYWRLQ